MKKQLQILILLFFISIDLNAQNIFQKTFGGIGADYGYSVTQTTDGGYIVSGFTSIGSFAGDIYLIKTDSLGDTLWTRTFGGTGSEGGISVQQTTDGGYIIAGYTNSFVTNMQVYVIKTDGNGDSLWTKTIGGVNLDSGNSIQQTIDGGYIISGTTNSSGGGNMDVYLIKINPSGNAIWAKSYGVGNIEYGYSAEQTTDSGYIIVGGNNTFTTDYDIYLIKTDVNGDTIWTKTFGGIGGDWGYSIRQTTDGGYIIAGWTVSFGAGVADVYLIKTDANGDSLWTKTFGGIDSEQGYSIQQTTDGGYVITGSTNSFGAGSLDVYLIKTDPNGNLHWAKTFGGTDEDYGYGVHQTADGGYIITGYTYSFGSGNKDVYLIKTDSLGNSGCNEGSTTTITSSTTTQILSIATWVATGATIVTTPTTVIGSGGIVSTPCNVGINEIVLDNSFLISPNPSSGNFEIKFSETINKGTVEIYNVPGERIFSSTIFNETKKEIHLKNSSGGIYFVKVFDGEKSYCRKIIVEKE